MINKIKSKKAQLSLFIFLGVFVVLVVSMLYLFMINASQEKRIVDEKINADIFKNYIDDCLKNNLEEAIFLLGRQGGYIYENQGGINFNGKTGNYKGYKVVYRVTNFDTNIILPPPEYPCIVGWPNCNFMHEDQFIFGNALYRAACNKEIVLPGYLCSAPNYRDSAQEQIEKYIITKIQDCNIKSLAEEYGVDLKFSKPKAEVFLGNDDVSVKLDYNIKINSSSGTTNINNFEAKVKIKLKNIYDFINEILGKDTNNITYDILDSLKSTKTSINFNDLEIKKERISNGDYIIIIKDKKSKIKGDNYIFQFLIKNRAPALDYIEINNPITLP
ncbi:MAG: hypothetical protein QXU20_02330, partial [Candidatus Woesearchaeota archaeon]